MLIIDCHGHYTTAPEPHQAFRKAQLARYADPKLPPVPPAKISDEQIRETIEKNQLRLQKDRGADMTLFSPRASAMAHHEGDGRVSMEWSRACNDLIKRVVDLYPENFAGGCMLPQSPGVPITESIAELERCVRDLGFVGCNLNPDPSGGHWTSPPLIDRSWYPFFEKMVELDVPAMIHVSSTCNPNFHATGAHYINADTTAFMQFIEGDLFRDFPSLRFVIPHGAIAITGGYQACRHAETPITGRTRDAQRVLRYLRLSSAGRRSAVQSSISTTSCWFRWLRGTWH
jgi:4-oxalmesaconate hydratase